MPTDDLFKGGLPHRIGIDVMLKEVERELNKRRSVYPKLVDKGTLSFDQAQRQILIMEAVQHLLETAKDARNDLTKVIDNDLPYAADCITLLDAIEGRT